MQKVKFLDLKKQYLSIKEEIDLAIKSVIEEQLFVKGHHLDEFEKSFSKYLGSKYCVGVGNGTDALEISLKALDLPRNSEIILPANSFISTAEAISNCGHKVVFCDISPKDYSIDLECLSSLISQKTKGIIVVHLYGIPTVMEPILEISKRNNLFLIEDCAQAHGAEYNGTKVGNFGDLGCFSFYPGKNLGAYGDGGAIVTNNSEIATKSRMIANHGRVSKYDHKFIGRNSRLDSLQAAILNVKLKHLDSWIKRRKKIATIYDNEFSKIKQVRTFNLLNEQNSVFHLYVIRIKKRDELRAHLEKHNIQTGIHYPISLNKLDAYSFVEQDTTKFRSNQIANEILSIPIGEHLEEKQIIYICEIISFFFNE